MASFANKLARCLRNWRMSTRRARQCFPHSTLEAVTVAIAQGEQEHRSELRLIVEAALPTEAAWKGQPIRQRALAMFAEYGIWDTEDNCGVLLYVNLAERKVEIVADRGINRKVTQQEWQAICHAMTRGFAHGHYHEATVEAIAQLNALLRAHFPGDGQPRPNELPDQPLVL